MGQALQLRNHTQEPLRNLLDLFESYFFLCNTAVLTRHQLSIFMGIRGTEHGKEGLGCQIALAPNPDSALLRGVALGGALNSLSLAFLHGEE